MGKFKTSKRTETKIAILKGTEYKSAYTGKVVSAKKTGPDCKCCLKCVSSINEESRSKILSELLHIENKDAQDIHLQRLIEVSTIKQKRPIIDTGEHSKPKTVTFNYFVLHESERKKVCQKAFISLHGISTVSYTHL